MHRTLELLPLCRDSLFFLSLWHDYTMTTTSSCSSSNIKKRKPGECNTYARMDIYTRLDRNSSRMTTMIGLLLLMLSSSIHMMPYTYTNEKKRKKRRDTMLYKELIRSTNCAIFSKEKLFLRNDLQCWQMHSLEIIWFMWFRVRCEENFKQKESSACIYVSVKKRYYYQIFDQCIRKFCITM